MDHEEILQYYEELQELAQSLRAVFGIPRFGPLPVLEILERLPDVFPGCIFEIVEDDTSEDYVKTYFSEDEKKGDGCVIKIKNSVYEGVYKNESSLFEIAVLNEIFHLFILYFI